MYTLTKTKERNRAPLVIAIACTPTGRIQHPKVSPGSIVLTPGYWRPHRSLSSHSKRGERGMEAHMWTGIE
jgi:hypothetical protein